MSIYKLHWISGSAYAWRVMLALSHKNIKYESQIIDAATWDREASGFLKLNPRGKVPVLEDGDNGLSGAKAPRKSFVWFY
ncbi:MAG: glutathione S-transferase N-terminal domain-containing protein [Gammaproteobacteria bacterium]|nr:glutathione S-transferase N-terminal domain-containing protein [Gammaproteobacteria bacterium]